MHRTRLLAAALPALLLAGPSPTRAETEGLRHRFLLSAGVFLADLRTDAKVNVSGEADGTPIDLEKDFGLSSDATELRLEGHFRFTKRHRVFWDFTTIGRDRSATLEQDWTIGDVTFEEGSRASLSSDLEVLGLGYRFEAVCRPKFELGLSLAPSIMDVEFALDGSGTVDDGSGPQPFDGKRSASVSAPVPLLGVHFDFFPHEKWQVRSGIQYIGADLGDFDGSMLQSSVRVDFFPTPKFGVGAGWSSTRIKLDDFEEESWDGELEARYSALYAYLSLRL